jgi:uncharacterized membrane-anchored protein
LSEYANSINKLQAFSAIASGEQRLEFRLRGNDVRIVTNAFFFQEGSASTYETAKFGEFRVNENGTTLLANMLNDKMQLIVPSPNPIREK